MSVFVVYLYQGTKVGYADTETKLVNGGLTTTTSSLSFVTLYFKRSPKTTLKDDKYSDALNQCNVVPHSLSSSPMVLERLEDGREG